MLFHSGLGFMHGSKIICCSVCSMLSSLKPRNSSLPRVKWQLIVKLTRFNYYCPPAIRLRISISEKSDYLFVMLLIHVCGIVFSCCQDYIKDPDRKFVADTVAAIALCAQKLPSIATACLEGLLTLVFYGNSLHVCIFCVNHSSWN